MRREIQSLTDRLAAMKSGSRKGNKKKTTSVQSTSQASVVSVSGSGSRRKRKTKIGNLSNGQITLSRKEVLTEVKSLTNGSDNKWSVALSPASFNFLQKFSMFDRFKFNSLKLFYKPLVSATHDGSVIYGVCWDPNTTKLPSSRSEVASLTPCRSHALWFDGEAQPMNLPVSRLQTRPWFTLDATDAIEKQPGILFCCLTDASKVSATVGEIWAEYSVTLMGSTF